MLLVLPLLVTALAGCKSIEDIQKEVLASGEPVIMQLIPSVGRRGDTITLRGLNFGTAIGKVGFQDLDGNITVADIASWQDDFIVVKVPNIPGAPEVSQVHLQTADLKRAPLQPSFRLN